MKLTQLFIATLAVCTLSYATEKPNIVMIVADDQGWGDLSVSGIRVKLSVSC